VARVIEIPMTSYYETDRAVAEYLLFHYGLPEEVLPYDAGPVAALNFPARCASECVESQPLPVGARALDLGCAVGRSAFELARCCGEVIGIDYSSRFIAVAGHLQRNGSLDYARLEEGDLTLATRASVAPDIERSRVRFEQGDAMQLRGDLGEFDVVLLANLIDRLRDPRACLERLPGLVKTGGRLVITSPYTWLREYTPRENWLGGFEHEGRPVRALQALHQLLTPEFRFIGSKDMPFLIREHARKFQWSVAEASLWLRC
jgi:putative 4-mercaptohistidine N1-methyltranferase